jgi:hypothetical protein
MVADRGDRGPTVAGLGSELQLRVLPDHARESVAEQRLSVGDDNIDHGERETTGARRARFHHSLTDRWIARR